MHSAKIPFKLSIMYNLQFTMLGLKLDWKQHCYWVFELNAINVYKSLNFITYSSPVVDNPLSPMAPPKYVIDTFVLSITKSLDFEF